ncbi:hypothetical protein J3459_015394 [Metarhizium acridum]|nr:hypothetical protein J3459_015394 [Metarhizium acridum]
MLAARSHMGAASSPQRETVQELFTRLAKAGEVEPGSIYRDAPLQYPSFYPTSPIVTFIIFFSLSPSRALNCLVQLSRTRSHHHPHPDRPVHTDAAPSLTVVVFP